MPYGPAGIASTPDRHQKAGNEVTSITQSQERPTSLEKASSGGGRRSRDLRSFEKKVLRRSPNSLGGLRNRNKVRSIGPLIIGRGLLGVVCGEDAGHHIWLYIQEALSNSIVGFVLLGLLRLVFRLRVGLEVSD